jgi:hypothetical protein
MFKKGDLVLPIDRVQRKDWLIGLYHPAVIWDKEFDGEGDFIGIMLSSKGPEQGNDRNILMEANQFKDGHLYGFKNSHFVNQVFIKLGDWGDFELVGRLTDLGTDFVQANLTNTDPVSFNEYYEGNN